VRRNIAVILYCHEAAIETKHVLVKALTVSKTAVTHGREEKEELNNYL